MNENFVKRGYYMPPQLVSLWENFHRPSKDFSASISGACAVWMALPPNVREKARHAACDEDVAGLIDQMKDQLLLDLLEQKIAELLSQSAITGREAAAVANFCQKLVSPDYRRRRQAEAEAAEDEAAAAHDAEVQRDKVRRPRKARDA